MISYEDQTLTRGIDSTEDSEAGGDVFQLYTYSVDMMKEKNNRRFSWNIILTVRF